MSILEVKNIVKIFGDYKANNDISFSVDQGKIFGLLGPNGAGKTTLIRMITNIIVPDSGEITLFGENIESNIQHKIAYLPEERGLYKKLKVLEQLVYFGKLKDLSHRQATNEARKWLKKLDIEDWADKKVQELSKGMQQKVQFISTILHNPDFLILDEPFSGFDPVNTDLLRNIIKEMKAQGKTIILSTHVMHQVEQMCDDIALINKGELLLSGTVRDIKKQYGSSNIIIEFNGDDSFLEKLTGVDIIHKTDSQAEIFIHDKTLKTNDILKLAMEHAEIIKFQQVEPSLHEIFVDVVSEENDNAK